MSNNALATPDRRALLAGLGGLAAGSFLATNHAQAGPLNPPGAPAPTLKPLSEVEPRIAINGENTPGTALINYVISEPGSYYLTENLIGPAGAIGISIQASGVTIDLNGFRLEGTGTPTVPAPAIACDPDITNVQICNGRIMEWRGRAIDAGEARNVEVQGIEVLGSEFDDAIVVGNNSLVARCSIHTCFVGIAAGDFSRVEQCRVAHMNGDGIQIGEGSVVDSCDISDGFVAGVRVLGVGTSVSNCSIRSVGIAGVYIVEGSQSMIVSNMVTHSEVAIRVDTNENIIDANTALRNGTGFNVLGVRNVVIRNRAVSIGANYSIVESNFVGPVTAMPLSDGIIDNEGGAGVGTTNPWANLVF